MFLREANMEIDQALWAKKGEQSGEFYWLPLPVHLKDTMDVAGWLWDHWLSSSQRRYIASQIDSGYEEDAARLVRFLGGVHDIGKATPAFQIQKGYQNSADLDISLLERLERAGFSGISDLTLNNPKASHHALAGETILHNFHVRDDLGSIVGAHHGKPIDSKIQYINQSAYPVNYYQSADAASDLHRKWDDVQKTIFDWALEKCSFENPEDLPQVSEAGQILLSGLLIMADWISSNERYFPLIPVEQTEVQSDERFERGMSAWYQNMPLEIDRAPVCLDLYRNRFQFSPSEIQKKIFETVEKIQKPGIMIIEAPMGCGKTEAALVAAEQIAGKTGCSGLFFGLPTQATSNGMFQRVVDWLDHLAGDYGQQASIRLSHGSAALNDVMQNLANHIDVDGAKYENVSVNEWFAGRKKSALDDFVVGTVDHFLLTALKQKHLALRHLGFSKKVVIIDEVHAYDAYMQQYLERAIQWMGAYHVPVILLSATLPSEKRRLLISSYLKGQGVKNRELGPYFESLRSEAYPLISYTDGKEIRLSDDFPEQHQRKVHVRPLAEEDLMDKVGSLMSDGGVIGIVVNTVKKAQRLAHQCADRFGDDMVVLLHSAYIATDRAHKEQELIQMIGKNGKRPRRKIIIGTQVIEQSLDIDFDVMISDLCPIDLLLQRIGRLQRHQETKRAAMHQEPVLYVMGLSDQLEFEPGSRSVYGEYYLTRTQYVLPDVISVPADIPELVQKVYSDDEIILSEDLKDKYEEGKRRHEKYRSKEEEKAKVFRIRPPKQKIQPDRNNMIRWLEDYNESDSDIRAAAQVRDIQETIEIIALQRIGSGYGLFQSTQDISDRIDSADTARQIAQQTLRLPAAAVRKSGIRDLIRWLEDYNRKYLSDWQKQPWLEGSLGVIFDENNEFTMGDCTLKYDDRYGLRIREEDEDYEQI